MESGDNPYTYSKHANVYLRQILSKNFKNTTEDFQEGTVGSFLVRVQKARNEKEDYKSLISGFNKFNGLGYEMKDRGSGGIQLYKDGNEFTVDLKDTMINDPHD